MQAVVTNHFIVRGSYRSLSLVIYGNTAEDLGQFNIEVDLDGSLTNTVSVIEGSLEDLPSALHQKTLAIENFICPLNALSLKSVADDISVEVKQFLHLTSKILKHSNLGDTVNRVVDSVVSAASTHVAHSLTYLTNSEKQFTESRLEKCDVPFCDLTEVTNELACIYNNLQRVFGSSTAESSRESLSFEFETEPVSSKQLMDSFSAHFSFSNDMGTCGHPQLSWVS